MMAHALRASRGGLGLLSGMVATGAMLLSGSSGVAQTPPATRTGEFLHAAPTTRIADPKLEAGRVEIGYQLDPGRTTYDITIALCSSTGQELFQLYHNRAGLARYSPGPFVGRGVGRALDAARGLPPRLRSCRSRSKRVAC